MNYDANAEFFKYCNPGDPQFKFSNNIFRMVLYYSVSVIVTYRSNGRKFHNLTNQPPNQQESTNHESIVGMQTNTNEIIIGVFMCGIDTFQFQTYGMECLFHF